jgi:hypothetical protein
MLKQDIGGLSDSANLAKPYASRTREGIFEYLRKTGLKEYQETEGIKEVLVLTREIGEQTEYVFDHAVGEHGRSKALRLCRPRECRLLLEDLGYFPESECTPYVRHYAVYSPVSNEFSG